MSLRVFWNEYVNATDACSRAVLESDINHKNEEFTLDMGLTSVSLDFYLFISLNTSSSFGESGNG